MGTMLALIFAAALQSAGDIKTGADLLAACQQKDTTACDQFVINSSQKRLGCSPGFDLPAYRAKERSELIHTLERHPSLQRTSAEHALYQIGTCEIDD